jgi:hypothetical protein
VVVKEVGLEVPVSVSGKEYNMRQIEQCLPSSLAKVATYQNAF